MAVSGPRVLTPAPYLLQRLLVEDSVEGRHYRNNIRRYNNTLAFAAFSTALNTRRLPGRGPNVFTVHGQGYWTISNDLIGNDPIQRRFCQLYFVESGETNRIRREQQQLLPAAQRLFPSVLEDLRRPVTGHKSIRTGFRVIYLIHFTEQSTFPLRYTTDKPC
ncbi:unnamed protein product [Macrosiphum euphorbiae]|uniref:Uncharacterized protein n=1 Tax=Macrosiphum euphorbiae TaxID=13131 RepID=A0AAV0XH76_9HEMI|nr:unnamed protein product [Macrosiphum euphorbiae]